MTHYDNYKKYHEALKNTNFSTLSNIIFNMQTITTKYNNELGNVSNGEWQDIVNPILQQKLSFSASAIQSLNNDISVNLQSMIDNGSKLLEILEQMQQKQVVVDGLTTVVSELNGEKNSLYNKLNSFQDKSTEEYNTAQSKYSSALSKYNNKKSELTTSQNEIDELGTRADLLIKKLQGISFTANIIGLLSGSAVAATSTSPPTPVAPIVTPTPTVKPKSSVIHLDRKLIEKLGIQVDENNNPLMKGNAYVAYYNGMGYLIYFPKDSNGNIKTNLPVIVEFHGIGEASTSDSKTKALGLPDDRTGLYQIAKNPKTPAIIIIPRASDGLWIKADEEKVHLIQENVIESLHANKNKIILHGYSSGGTESFEYCARYPDGVKYVFSIDGRPTREVVEKLSDLNIPVCYFTSQNAGIDESRGKLSYFDVTNNILKSMKEDYSLKTVTVKLIDSKDMTSQTLESKRIVEKALASALDRKETVLFHVIGTSHSTLKDFVTKIVNSYDILLK